MPSFWLEFEQNGATQRYPFDRPSLSMGRERTCDFHLDHPTVSRQHAMIVYDPRAGFKLLVMSKGGMTAVDGAQVQGEVAIYDGARLNIGQMVFTFRSQDPSARRPGMGGMAPLPGGSFGQPPGGGFGQTPGGAFGQPPGGGFGQPPGGAFGQPPGGGFGQPPGGGFGQAPATPAQAAPPTNTSANAAVGGVASWDEIAAGADEEEEVKRNMTDFERIEQAAAKANAKGGGTSPLLMVAVVIAVIAVVASLLMPSGGPAEYAAEDTEEQVPVQIRVDCLGKDDCMDKAKNAYKVGSQTFEKSDVTVSNLFESYKKFLEAKEYIAKSGAPAPKSMADLDDKIAKARAGLDLEYKKYRAAYRDAEGRKMYREMAKALLSIKSVFPDKTAKEHKWASEQEGKMKAAGNYPNLSTP
jgi:hypothetical protein